jgi:hypothetical protein
MEYKALTVSKPGGGGGVADGMFPASVVCGNAGETPPVGAPEAAAAAGVTLWGGLPVAPAAVSAVAASTAAAVGPEVPSLLDIMICSSSLTALLLRALCRPSKRPAESLIVCHSCCCRCCLPRPEPGFKAPEPAKPCRDLTPACPGGPDP